MALLKPNQFSMKRALKPSFQMSDDEALGLGSGVITALTDNPLIPSPQPTVAQLQTLWDAYNTSLSNARYGSRAQRSQKNTDKTALLTGLRDECDYINMIAKGDPDTLASCGLPLSKDRQPTVLGTPEAKVEQGASGELILSTPAVPGAVAYKHQYKPDENAVTWSEVTQSAATCKIQNLQMGTVYSLRIVAIGTKDQVTMSDVVSKMAA
jgi:hypothetical protein